MVRLWHDVNRASYWYAGLVRILRITSAMRVSHARASIVARTRQFVNHFYSVDYEQRYHTTHAIIPNWDWDHDVVVSLRERWPSFEEGPFEPYPRRPQTPMESPQQQAMFARLGGRHDMEREC